jgi:hypothetical protein
VSFGAIVLLYSLPYEVWASSNSRYLLSTFTCACHLPPRELTAQRPAPIDDPALLVPVSRRAPQQALAAGG